MATPACRSLEDIQSGTTIEVHQGEYAIGKITEVFSISVQPIRQPVL